MGFNYTNTFINMGFIYFGLKLESVTVKQFDQKYKSVSRVNNTITTGKDESLCNFMLGALLYIK